MQHIRLIVTEDQDDAVGVAYVVIGPRKDSVVRRTRALLRATIQQVAQEHPDAAPPADRIDAALERGYWWAELDDGDFSVQVFEPQSVEQAEPTPIVIDIRGGQVTDVRAPAQVSVLIQDFDTDGIEQARLQQDQTGCSCIHTRWEGGRRESQP
jgi:hypothetical protein